MTAPVARIVGDRRTRQPASFSRRTARALWRLTCASSFVLLLAACAPVRVHETAKTLAGMRAREDLLRPISSWSLNAHIAVSSGHDGGSGQLDWVQDGASYAFTVRAPVTGRTWKLSGDAVRAVLEGVDPRPDYAADAQDLLRKRLGWNVPLSDLRAWVRGLRAPDSPARTEFDTQGLPALIEQDGWKVEYRDWFMDRQPPLPRKVFASNGRARVRMLIESWSLHE